MGGARHPPEPPQYSHVRLVPPQIPTREGLEGLGSPLPWVRPTLKVLGMTFSSLDGKVTFT